MAECHPVGFQWVVEAKLRGATVIHVDPRFTRTSALADLHVPLRAGSDIAFLGGLIHHVLENDLDFREYVVSYTNAAAILREDFRDTEDLGGLFSGWDAETGAYDQTSWQYEGAFESPSAGLRDQWAAYHQAGGSESAGGGGAGGALSARPRRDESLQHPRTVYQTLRRHFARYTPEFVEQVCGRAGAGHGR
jgi:formate dehydrogenase major subunit